MLSQLESRLHATQAADSGTARRLVVAGVLALVIAMGIGRFAYTPILPVMRDAFGLPTATLGSLASANYLGYLVGAILAALVPSGRAHRLVLRGSLLAVVAATALMVATTSVPVWHVLRFVAGLGGAGIFVFASATVLGGISRLGRPELSGWFFSGVGTGIAVAGTVILGVNHLSGGLETWRADWLAIATLAALLTVPCWLWLGVEGDPELASMVPKAPDDETRGQSLPIVLLGGAYFLEGLGYIITGTFLVAIVAAVPALVGVGTSAWIVVGLGAAPAAVVWSWIAARSTPIAALVLAFVAQAIGIVLPAVSEQAWALAAILFGGTFVGITSLILGQVRRRVSPRQVARTFAVFTAVYGVGQIIGPLLAAVLAGDQGDFSRALVVAAGVVLLGGLFVLAAGLASSSREGDQS